MSDSSLWRTHRIQVLLYGFLLATFSFAAVFLFVMADYRIITKIEPSIVWKGAAGNVKISGVGRYGDIFSLQAPVYLTGVAVRGDVDRIERIEVRRDDSVCVFGPEQLAASKIVMDPSFTFASEPVHILPTPASCYHSRISLLKGCINYGGDGELVRKTLSSPVPWALIVLYVLVVCFVGHVVDASRPDEFNVKFTRRYWAVAAASFGFLACIVFWREHWYFLQDDDYTQFIPVLVRGLRGFYSTGIWPTVNMFQNGGVPTSSLGTYAFFYPPLHLSYFIATYILQDTWHINDVFSMMHIAAGFIFTVLLLRRQGCHPLLAIIAALEVCFSGYVLMVLRAWYYVAPTIAFLPLIAYLTLVWRNGWKKWVTIGLLFGVYCYGGNFQFWTYTWMFFVVWVLCDESLGKHWIHRCGAVATVTVVALLMYAPQLLATLHDVRSLQRVGGVGEGVMAGMCGVFLPWPQFISLPNRWGAPSLVSYNGYFYIGPYLFNTVMLASAIALLNPRIRSRFSLRYQLITLLFLFALVLSIGQAGFLWPLMSKLPGFKFFNYPFKYLLYVHFFGAIGGAVGVNSLLCRTKGHTRTYWAIIGCVALSFVALPYMVSQTRQAFFHFHYVRPYEPLPAELAFLRNPDARLVTTSPTRSEDLGFEHSLALNFPTVYGVASLDGYEPLNNNLPHDSTKHSVWGTRYYIVSYAEDPLGVRTHEFHKLSDYDTSGRFRKLYESPELAVYEDPSVDPVFTCYDASGARADASCGAINYTNNGFTLEGESGKSVRRVVAAVPWREYWRATADGRSLTIEKDPHGRMVIDTPQGYTSLVVSYRPFHVF